MGDSFLNERKHYEGSFGFVGMNQTSTLHKMTGFLALPGEHINADLIRPAPP
jgi:hypothetical protein